MPSLAKKAMERLKAGAGKPAPAEGPNPLKEVMKEAFEAAQANDFDRYFTAFESALDIKVAQMGEADDAEPYELAEVEQ